MPLCLLRFEGGIPSRNPVSNLLTNIEILRYACVDASFCSTQADSSYSELIGKKHYRDGHEDGAEAIQKSIVYLRQSHPQQYLQKDYCVKTSKEMIEQAVNAIRFLTVDEVQKAKSGQYGLVQP